MNRSPGRPAPTVSASWRRRTWGGCWVIGMASSGSSFLWRGPGKGPALSERLLRRATNLCAAPRARPTPRAARGRQPAARFRRCRGCGARQPGGHQRAAVRRLQRGDRPSSRGHRPRAHAAAHRRAGSHAGNTGSLPRWRSEARRAGRQPAEGGGVGGAVRTGDDGPRVLAMAAAATEPRHLLRRGGPPDGAHRDGPRLAMSDGARRRYPILYSVQRWNDGKWFYGGFFIILVVLIVIKVIQHQSIISFIPVTALDGLIVVAFWLAQRVSYIAVSDDGIEI